MAGPPFRSGAVQLTSRLVAEPEVVETDGAAGLAGFSSTSVTVMVTSMVSLSVPSEAFTVTE